MRSSSSTAILVVTVDPNFTDVAPQKLLPEMETAWPTGPEEGEKLSKEGWFRTVNVSALMAVPWGV